MQSFLPNLGLLRHQLESAIPPDQFRAAYFYLELLPYSLGATYQAFFDFVQAERELVTATLATNEDKNAIHAIGPAGRDKLSYRIDTFLETTRRTQNAVIPYISKALSISLPLSLNDLVKKIQSNKVSLPSKITSDLVGYWEHQGNKLKDYRDLSQHHALVASEVRIFHSSERKPAIYITLPNNPEEKNPAKLVFDNPPIQAFFYMKEQLHWLIRFCHEITTALTKPPGEIRAVSGSIVFRNPLQFGPGAQLIGHHLVTDEEIQNGIDNLVAQFNRI
jgi:hypothetical protein